MLSKKGEIRKKGVVLLIVLFIVMTVTVVSLGFIARSDVELSCGVNMVLKSQMDYLAQSGLEHARGILLNPQDVDTEYWTGATGLQLDSSSDDYYDVSILRTDYCNYQIQSQAYRSVSGEQIGSSKLQANLRLDPCIALRTGDGWTSETGLIVNGDVYVKGYLDGVATINGDAFAKDDIYATVNISGSENDGVDETIPFPDLKSDDFKNSYYIGNNSYSSYMINNFIPLVGSYSASVGNPAGICYCDGNLVIGSDTTILGTLVVHGDLTINGTNIQISARKNFPALIVDGKLKLVSYSQTNIYGLVQIDNEIEGKDGFGYTGGLHVQFTVNGSVFIQNHNIEGLSDWANALRINAYPDKSAIELWDSSGTATRWSSAGSAFYKSIERY